MTAEKQKRKRSANFSDDEKMRFLRIMQKKGQVIITKVTSHDFQSNRLKEDAWTEVTNAVNASRTPDSALRTKVILKNLWQKMKTDVKYNIQTNGACKAASKNDPILEIVADLTGFVSSGSPCSGLESANDCDTEVSCVKQIKIQEKKNLKRCWPTISNQEQSIPVTPKSPMNLDHNSLTSHMLKCEAEKLKLIELKKQQMIEQHALKIKEGNLKTKIFEAILKKIEDEKPVDSELIKIVSYM